MANFKPSWTTANHYLASPYGRFRFHKLFNIQNKGEVNYVYYGDVDFCLDLYGQNFERNVGIFKYTIKVQSYSRSPFSANGLTFTCNGHVVYSTSATVHFTNDKKLLVEGFCEIPAEADGSFVLEPLYLTTKVGTSTEAVSYYPFNNSPYTTDDIMFMQQFPFVLPTNDWRTIVDVRPGNAGDTTGGDNDTMYDVFYVDETVNAPFQVAIPWLPEGTKQLRAYIVDGYSYKYGVSTENGTQENKIQVWESYIDNPRAGETYDVPLAFDLDARIKIYEVIRNQHADLDARGTWELKQDAMLNAGLSFEAILESGEKRDFGIAHFFPIAVETTIPLLDCDVYDTNPRTVELTGSDRIIVRYASAARAEMNVTPTVGSIVETGITNGAETALNVTHHVFYNPQYALFEFYALDDRNIFGYDKIVTPFVEYVTPTARVKTSNITGEGEVNISVSGNYFANNFGVHDNTIQVLYRYKMKYDEEYSEWIELSDVEVDSATNTFTVSTSLDGLDYTRSYLFQAQVIDKIQNVFSKEYEAIARPIFDWSANDFNFNVPVSIMGKPVITGSGEDDDDTGGGGTVLWEGKSSLGQGEVLQLSAPISKQPNGIILVFEAISYDGCLTTEYVPKVLVNMYGGYKPFVFTMVEDSQVGKAYVGAKQITIGDTTLTGDAKNNTYCEVNSDYNISQIKHHNTFFQLVAVIGV